MSTARIYCAPVLIALLSIASGTAQGQSNFQKLQERLDGAAAAPAAAPASDPAPGYLGGEFDDPRGTQKGVVVNAVRPGAPAEAGGLKASDLITAIDGKAISNLNDLDVVLEKAVVGQKLRMTVNRAGRLTDLTVTLGTRPTAPAPGEGAPATGPQSALPVPRSPTVADPAPALGSPGPEIERPAPGGAFAPRPSFSPAPDAGTQRPISPAPAEPHIPADASRSGQPSPLGPLPTTGTPLDTTPARPEADQNEATSGAAGGGEGGPSLGITVDEPNEAARQRYGLANRRGALITAVRAGSPADRAGLPVGGLVVRLDARPIHSADDLVTAIRAARPGQEVEVGYFKGTEFRQTSIMLGSASAPAAAGSLPRASSGLSGDRALLGHVERKVDNFVRGGVSGPSTVYNPSAMAALQAQVAELTETVKRLEEQLHTLQAGRGGAAISPPAAPAPAITPGFGTAPIGPATPGFVPGLGQPGINP